MSDIDTYFPPILFSGRSQAVLDNGISHLFYLLMRRWPFRVESSQLSKCHMTGLELEIIHMNLLEKNITWRSVGIAHVLNSISFPEDTCFQAVKTESSQNYYSKRNDDP